MGLSFGSRISKFFQNMFALSSPLTPLEEEKCDEFLRRAAEIIVKRRMTVPVTFLLEVYKPVTLLGHQAFLILQPLLQALFNIKESETLIKILEDRGRVERFIQIIEESEKELKKQ